MNRAMFSGVAGLKAHQTKMDVIGNNIANVNTYGYKAQRTVFSDVYYQTLRGASAGTASKGGTNPSSVGYGSSVSAVQAQMSSSSMQSTGFGMDVAIGGEGFLQVMDGDGNTFYTKAGMLDYDANGYLIDINGNFVLGAKDSTGNPSNEKIKLDQIGSVEAAKPSSTVAINGIEYEISASNSSKYGNVSLAIGSSEDLPDGMPAKANISSTGQITVQLNAYEKFESMTELNAAINEAITDANEGKEHAAGTFTISTKTNVFGKDAVNAFVSGSMDSIDMKVEAAKDFFNGKLEVVDFKPKDGVAVAETPPVTVAKNISGDNYTISVTIDGKLYENKEVSLTSTDISLTAADGGTLELGKVDGTKGLMAADFDAMIATPPQLTLTTADKFLGGAKITGMSSKFPYEGTPQFSITSSDGTYAMEIKVGDKVYKANATPGSKGVVFKTDSEADGTITMDFPPEEEMKINLGLKATATATDIEAALKLKTTDHKLYCNAYVGPATNALTGAQIAGDAGGVEKGTITGYDEAKGFFEGNLKIQETSSDFQGSGTVKKEDFYAEYFEGDEEKGILPRWDIVMKVNGTEYKASIDEETKASSLLLKSDKGDYMQVSNPEFEGLNDLLGTEPTNGAKIEAQKDTTAGDLTVTPAKDSENLGLGTDSINLVGGTEGGPITLDQLTNITIGTNGVVTVAHPDKGVVIAGKVSLANFANPSGLQLQGNNYFAETANSGEPQLTDPGSGGTGSLKNSTLEMSNVDLSEQMAEMITTQRGFQANSRIITITDTMLEELINLKR